MLKLLFYTAIRASELVRIETTDVDLDHCKIFIDRGKGNKDRYILFPESFRLVLKSHLKANPKNRYLFESRRFGAFSPRRVQQIVYQYRQRAGIAQPVHPHLFRHQMLTYRFTCMRMRERSISSSTVPRWEKWQHRRFTGVSTIAKNFARRF